MGILPNCLNKIQNFIAFMQSLVSYRRDALPNMNQFLLEKLINCVEIDTSLYELYFIFKNVLQ